MNIAIIGAGVAGLAAAHDLAKAGSRVTVFEAAPYAGGLASGFRDPRWSWPLEKFYHHIFTTDTAIIDLAKTIGFGDKLFGDDDNDGVTDQGFNSAFESITQGNQTGWNLGIEASIPFGYRQAHLLVRNLELRATRARAALAEQELEIAHEVRNAYQTLDRTYAVAQSAFNRRVAAEDDHEG